MEAALSYDGGATALQPGLHSKTLSLKKNKKNQVWWLTPVIPALWEAKAGRSLEVQEFKTSLGNIARPCLYKKLKN